MTNSWAISIGINHYENHPENRLRYAINDAQHISDFLTQNAGFPKSQVILCLGDENNKGSVNYPTCSNLLRLLNRDLHPDRLGRIDRFWLFFSGHGISRNGRDYLITSDSLLEDIDLKISLSTDEIVAALQRHKEAEIVLILDACRIEGGKGQALRDTLYEGITTIFSCKPYESSWEIGEPISQGAFTHALLQNFRQQINENYLTVEQTERDLQQRLRVLTQQYGKLPQTPHIRCDSARKAQQFLLPRHLLGINANHELQRHQLDHKKRKSRQGSMKSALALKSNALKAEEAGQFELARQLWLQILATFSSEQEASIKAIDRIAVRLASQPLLSSNSEVERKLSSNIQVETAVSPPSQQGGKADVSQHNQELILLSIPGTQSFKFEVITLDANGREINCFQGQAQSLIEELNSVVLEMVVVPGGTFSMGSSERKPLPNELPAHWVTVKPFLMSRYPVTKEQWKEIAKLPKVHQELKLRPSIRGGSNHPVVEISWNEAIEFCNRLTQSTGYQYRLPTEAEWEYACRAGTTTPFHFGTTITSALACYNAEKTVQVGSFPFANAFGLSDMHGNIWEWCQDHWHDNYNEAPTTGTAWLDSDKNQNRLIRGGSWRNEARLCRSTSRMFDNTDSKSSNIGFRIVRLL
jgi:formylglycine-generating enzyme required for sulfatase activity